MRRLIGLVGIALAAGWLVLTAGPALAQSGPNGNVTATVQVQAAACLTISSPPSFSYPPSGFSTTSSLVVVSPSGSRPTVTSCSSGTQDFLARGAQATGSGGNWQLATTVDCNSGSVNQYRHEVVPSLGPALTLSTTDQLWEGGLANADVRTLVGRLTMPCTTSNGSGTTMSLPIVVTAVVR